MAICKSVCIIGAGPAGLTAAINLALSGFNVTVYEASDRVGSRLSGDFQGLENWSTAVQVPEFLTGLNLKVNFLFDPYSHGTIYTDDGRPYHIRSERPMFYLVRRGSETGCLDVGLRDQALEAGVRIAFHERRDTLEGHGIVATGPRGADAIVKGLVFETDSPDSASVILDNRLAPAGYAYLLINRNSATLATGFFRDFRREREFFERTVERFDRLTGVKMNNPREFGGFGNFSIPQSAIHGGKLHVGEAAGFQDYLWGFGMRYAMLSGYLAARSIIEGANYDRLWKGEMLPQLKTSMSNRFIFAHLGNRGYRFFASKVEKVADVRGFLYSQYNQSWIKRVIYPFAGRAYERRLKDWSCSHMDCDCVWCRCQREPSSKQSSESRGPGVRSAGLGTV